MYIVVTTAPGERVLTRLAKFVPKVGSRRSTKIKNLVVLVIILVVLILLPYYMYVVLVLILLFLLVRERKLERFVGMKICGSNLVVRRTTRPQFLVVLIYFLVTEDA